MDLRLDEPQSSDWLTLRASVLADAYDLGPRLREADKLEISLSSGSTPEQALAHGVAVSRPCCTIEIHGRPEVMFGLLPVSEEEGVIWMLSSDVLLEHRQTFLRLCRPILRQFLMECPVLTNAIHAENHVHLRWIEWCKAELSEPFETLGGAKFIRFEVRHV